MFSQSLIMLWCSCRGQYEFLAHAVLGLGATHLTVTGAGDHSKAALHHRVTAITALNERLPRAHLSQADADAAFGAMLSLTFQAAYMPDGMVDFLTMIRGCKWYPPTTMKAVY